MQQKEKKRVALPLSAQDFMRVAFGKIIDDYVQKLCACEAGVMDRDSKSIHDMRVIIRRMRVAIQVFKPFLGGEKSTRASGELKKWGDSLGKVRDLDVLREAVDEFLGQCPTQQTVAFLWLSSLLERQRRQVSAQMVGKLNSMDYRQYKQWLMTWSQQSGGNVDEPASKRLCDEMPSLLWRYYGRIRSYELMMDHADVTGLHKLRVDCKRFRYLLGFIKPLVGETATPLLRQLVMVQDYLGEMHDDDLAANRLEKMYTDYFAEQAQDGQTREDEKTISMRRLIEDYIRYKRERVGQSKMGFQPLWETLVGTECRNWLGQVCARI